MQVIPVRVLVLFIFLFSAPTLFGNLGNDSNPREFVSFNGLTYFAASHPEFGVELWRTDGTETGTALFADLSPGINSIGPEGFFVLGPQMFFRIGDALWRTDGTQSGTAELMRFIGATTFRKFAELNGTLYLAVEFSNSMELWSSDGTTAGTQRIKVFGSRWGFGELMKSNSLLLFSAYDITASNYALWVYDGIASEPRVLKSGSPDGLAAVNGFVIFSHYDTQTERRDLWRSDGTEAGTFVVRENFALTPTRAPGPVVYMRVGTNQVWRTDATASGTYMLKELPSPIWHLQSLRSAGNKVYFFAFGHETTYELWGSDGTPEGTRSLKTFVDDPYDSWGRGVTTADGRLFFASNDGASGIELWSSDGTPEGTGLVRDIYPGESGRYVSLVWTTLPNDSRPYVDGFIDGLLYFSAIDGVHGREPWITDGTSAGTRMLANIHDEGVIEGFVRSTTGAPIANVAINVSSMEKSYPQLTTTVLTDVSGAYRVNGLRDGTYILGTGNSQHWVDQMYNGLSCPGCSYTEADRVNVSVGTTVSGVDFTLTRGGAVTGNVTHGSTGAPLADVTVALYEGTTGSVATAGRTDSSGNFITGTGLSPGTYYARTSNALGYSNQVYQGIGCVMGCAPSSGTPIVITAEEHASGVNFQLLPREQVSGRVTDAVSGDPVSGVSIWVWRENAEAYRGAVSDVNGAYSLMLPDGGGNYLYTQDAQYWGFRNQVYSGISCPTSSSCPITSGTRMVDTPGQITPGVDFRLARENGRMRGVVRDSATGIGIGGISISIYDEARVNRVGAVTAADGTWDTSFTIPDGEYTVVASTGHNNAYLSEVYGGAHCPPGCDVSVGAVLTIQGGNTLEGIDVALDAAARIDGTVVDWSTGEPLAGATVRAYRLPGTASVASVTTSADGSFSVPGLYPGSFTVQASGISGYEWTVFDDHSCPEACDVFSGTPIEVSVSQIATPVVRMRPFGNISGTVTDALTGLPLSGVTIWSSWQNAATTDDAGQFATVGLRSGNHRVWAAAPGYITQVFDGVDCLADDCLYQTVGTNVVVEAAETTTSVNFSLSKTVVIKGTVFDAASGLPLNNAAIWLYDESGLVETLNSGDDGSYRIPDLFPRTYWIRAQANGFFLQLYSGQDCPSECYVLQSGTPINAGLGDVITADFALTRVVKIGDFNLDRKVDLIWRNPTTGENYLWFMNGVVQNGGAALPWVGGSEWKIEAIADFNDDYSTDLVWRNYATGENFLWLMWQANFFRGVPLPHVGDPNWRIVAAADLSRDGKPDLLWRNGVTGENYLWTMDGAVPAGGVSLPYVGGEHWRIEGSADFNGDGHIDLVWRNYQTGENYLWLMNGTSLASGAPLPIVPDPAWEIQAVADFSGDGVPDLIWRHTTRGENFLWVMNGTAKGEGVPLAWVPAPWYIAAP